MLGNELVHAVEQRAAARQADAVFRNIARELGGSLFEEVADGFENVLKGLLKRVYHFIGADGDRLRQTGDEVSALYVDIKLLLAGVSGADADLHILGRALADQEIVLLAHVADYRLIEFIARDLYGFRKHGTAEGDYRNVGSTAADIDDHVASGLGNIYARADGGRDGFLNEVGMARAGFLGGVDNGALFDLGNAGGHAYDHAGLEEYLGPHDLLEEVAQEPFGDVEIGDNAVAQGADCDDVAGGAAEHAARLFTDGIDVPGDLFYGNDGGLAKHDALVLNIYKNAGGTQIDTNVVKFKQTHDDSPFN